MEQEKENSYFGITTGNVKFPSASHPPKIEPRVLVEENNNCSDRKFGAGLCTLTPGLCTVSPGCEGSKFTTSHTRMNTNSNGYSSGTRSSQSNGNIIPSTSANVAWLADVASHNSLHGGHDGMLTGSAIDTRTATMLASATTPLTGILRTSSTVGEPSVSRHNSLSALYPPNYQSHAAVVAAAQGGQLPSQQYSAYYQQLAGRSPSYAAAHQPVLPSHYPRIDSYSAVLQSMTSQVQQSQLPRGSHGYGSHVPQYSQRSLSVSTTHAHDPGAQPRHSPATGGLYGDAELKSSIKYDPGRDSDLQTLMKDNERSLSLSAIDNSPSGGKTVSFKDPPPRGRDPRDPGDYKGRDLRDPGDYKVPSGKEGSLKHRILRPSESGVEGATIDYKQMEPSPHKRAKLGLDSATGDNMSRNNPVRDGSLHRNTAEPFSGQSTNLHYPPHFMKGSIIELANGELKRVEDLQTEDFVQSADISNDLKIDSSTVVRTDENIVKGTVLLGFVVGEHKVQVTVEATIEHPFFVFGQGWSSCDPSKSLRRYGLHCELLSVGDVCISLTHREVRERGAELSQQQQQEENRQRKTAMSTAASTLQDYVQQESIVKQSSLPHLESSTKEGEIKMDQHPIETRPPRKRQWSSSDHVLHDSLDHK